MTGSRMLEPRRRGGSGTEPSRDRGRGRALLLRRSASASPRRCSSSCSWSAAIYVLLPKVFDTQNALDKLGDANAIWIAVALAFNVLAFFSYVALFRGVVGEQVLHLEWRESYQITMAGLAATRLFSAGGAGGIVLTYWALRKAGMPRRQTACRMVAFLVLLYAVYMLALVLVRDPAAHRSPHGRQPGRPDDRPGGARRRRDRGLPADRADPRGRRAPPGGFARGYRFSGYRAAPGHGAGHARKRHAHGDRLRPRPVAGRAGGARRASASGQPTSAILWAASTPSTPTSRSESWCRDSSSAWSPTCSRSPPAASGPWTRG